jgi:glycogen(starch) synthase
VVTEFKERILPDIVHVNFYGPSAYFHLSTARSLPTKTVVTFHNLLTANAGHDGLVQALLKKATAVAAVSPAGARNIELAMGYPRQRISIIAPGVPSDMFAPAQGGRPGLPTVIFIGRLVDDKGADIAVRAMQFLKGKATLKIVGDGPERPKLENLARQLSLEDSVSFAGQVGPDQRRQILADAFVMVVPSRWEEPFGTVAAEGALSSLPVIATRRGGLPETVKDRETGIIIPPEDPPALVAALRSLLDDPTLAETMGRAGRSRALREFSLEETVNRYETLYFKACTDTH